MKIVFARDENGEIKRRQPCQTEGCNWPNWHICLIDKPDTFPELVKKIKKTAAGRKLPPRSDAYLHRISESQQERWEKTNGARDRKMVEYYKNNNVGYKKVAEQFGVSGSTALKALKKAEAEGKLVMRSRGLTIRHSNK